MNTDMIAYYKARSNEYEKIYSKPERQADILKATEILQAIFKEKEVFEIACGTGFWTEKISSTAHSVTASDINEPVINIARAKNLSNVSFNIANLYDLNPSVKNECLFAGFIWSHIKLQELGHFIDTINKLVKRGGEIVFMDNNYIEGSNLPVTETDTRGNTYQVRKLEDGTIYKVVKNFPAEKFIRKVLQGHATDVNFISLPYYWILQYKTL